MIITEAFLDQRLASKPPGYAPLMPGARQVLQTHTESTDLLLYVASATPAEVERFYQETLGKAGYREAQKGVFQRKDDELQLSATARENKETAVQVLHRRVSEPIKVFDPRFVGHRQRFEFGEDPLARLGSWWQYNLFNGTESRVFTLLDRADRPEVMEFPVSACIR